MLLKRFVEGSNVRQNTVEPRKKKCCCGRLECLYNKRGVKELKGEVGKEFI